jgi:ankyrin repeat protein
MNKNKILILFIILMIFNFLPHSLLWTDSGPPMDLYKAVDYCNYTKILREYGNATDEHQLDRAVEAVRNLIETGSDPNMRIPYRADIHGYGAYFWIMYGEITLLMLSRVPRVSELLVDYGARVNDQDDYGRTALMLSVFFDHHYYRDKNIITKMLLEKGAEINTQNKAGQTALYYAIMRQNIEAIELLISNGASINIRDNRGWSPLMAAKIYNYNLSIGRYSETEEKIIQILTNAGAALNDSDEQLIESVNRRDWYTEKNEGLNMARVD